MKEITFYKCEICDNTYDTSEQAQECELVVPDYVKEFNIKVGDEVIIFTQRIGGQTEVNRTTITKITHLGIITQWEKDAIDDCMKGGGNFAHIVNFVHIPSQYGIWVRKAR